MRFGFAVIAAAALSLISCSETSEPLAPDLPLMAANYIAEGNPETLRQWGQVQLSGGTLVLSDDVVPYDLNTPLFTDYAHKLRTIWMPEGSSANYRTDEVLDFPVGTVITKTFYYPLKDGEDESQVLSDSSSGFFRDGKLPLDNIRLIETRVLVLRDAGWEAIPYRWNDEQTQASLNRIGGIIPLSLVSEDGEAAAFDYVMPNVNECASCHASDSNSKALWPIGLKARHLNRDFTYDDGTQNQLTHLTGTGFLTGAPDDLTAAPMNAAWGDLDASLDARARSYLDINCSHCHSPIGPADTSGLSLLPDASGAALGKCKLPIAAGAGTGNRRWGIHPGKPEESILVYRLESDEADKMMPEIGRSTVHEEGAVLVSDWVKSMEGDCG